MMTDTLAYDFDQRFVNISQKLYRMFGTSPSIHYNPNAKTFVINMSVSSGLNYAKIASKGRHECKHKALNSFIEELQQFINESRNKKVKIQSTCKDELKKCELEYQKKKNDLINKINGIDIALKEIKEFCDSLNNCAN